MKKVILICNTGISNSLLVKHIQEATKEKKYTIRCKFYSCTKLQR